MSDILIKGMKMPKHDDEYVIFTVYGDGRVVYDPLNRPYVRYKNRAVPIPPHGRLIDADALDADLERQDMHTGEWDAVGFSIEEIENAPTIIEAEEVEA